MIHNYNKVPYDMQDKVVQVDSKYIDETQPSTTFEGTLIKELGQLHLN
ncbi:MAG: hypothetical protein PV340_04330 [Wolbachia sp.]|nr:hypothetical protein [Wolbachia sp.]MDD9336610.1 hypothetical protein [Wolbachia sp.]